uniref:EOG090X0G5X n=1 Tax=Daphnia pulex TaxID=6669 RepID=A0A4Y7MUK9_DAPPU|nr:EOG090X0G5X [Daphnia pulex]
MEDYEAILLVKQEVFVFKIPPRTSNRGYRAADWNLSAPDWTGRMRLLAKGTECILKLEDKVSGELFAKCPVDTYPGIAIEAVSDSSRYFVVRIQDDSGRAAFIGVGFADRSDSFDLNVALQDHFKWVKQSQEIEKEGTTEEAAKPRLDLSFKAGETIKINMKIGKKDGDSVTKPKAKTLGGLPPPPGGLLQTPVSSNWPVFSYNGYLKTLIIFSFSLIFFCV